MKVAVILPAAGVGRRFQAHADPGSARFNARPNDQGAGHSGATGKLELDLMGKPVFLRAVELFVNRREVQRVILAVNPAAIDDFRTRYGDVLSERITVVPGGTRERWETVMLALRTVPESCTHVAVHDAARPLASAAMIDRVFAAAARYPAVIPAMPVSDTLKRMGNSHAAPEEHRDEGAGIPVLKEVIETVDRRALVAVQTPQMFEISLLRRAYQALEAALKHDDAATHVTDDASLVEALGEPVHIVEGEATNLKITRPADAALARAILMSRDG